MMDTTTRVDHIAVALGWTALGLFAYLLYLVLAPFLIPLGWAAVLAILTHRLHAGLARRMGKSSAAALTTVAIALVVVVPTLLVMSAFVQQAVAAAGAAQRAVAEGRLSWLERAAGGVLVPATGSAPDLAALAAEAARRASAFLVDQSGLVLRDVALWPVKFVIALFATFFLLRDSDPILRAIRRLLPMPGPMRETLMTRTTELVTVGVTAGLAVAAVQGLLGGLAFWAVGIREPVFWGVVMGAFCLLPFGAWVIWVPTAVLLMAQGDIGRGLTVALLGLTTVSAADNVLRPMLMSGRAHVHGLVIFIGLLGGVRVFGALGLVLGPILVATALALVAAYVETPAHDAWRV